MLIQVAGLDPSLRNWGLARGTFDTKNNVLALQDIRIQETESEKGKTVRASSDDLRCAGLLVTATHKWIADCGVVFAEVPSGSQSARGSFSNGICLGVMGSIGPVGGYKGRLIQVTPSEVKKAATGYKTASKDDMIMWAMEAYPHLPWIITSRGANKGQPSPTNEHMADAVAAIHAGVRTDQFLSLTALANTISESSYS